VVKDEEQVIARAQPGKELRGLKLLS